MVDRLVVKWGFPGDPGPTEDDGFAALYAAGTATRCFAHAVRLSGGDRQQSGGPWCRRRWSEHGATQDVLDPERGSRCVRGFSRPPGTSRSTHGGRRSSRRGRSDPPTHCQSRPAPTRRTGVVEGWLIAEALDRLSDAPAGADRDVLSGTFGRRCRCPAWRAAGTIKSRTHYALRALRLALTEMGVIGVNTASGGGPRSGTWWRHHDLSDVGGVTVSTLLGALSPAQRQAYEHHLSTCAECRAEVGDLAILARPVWVGSTRPRSAPTKRSTHRRPCCPRSSARFAARRLQLSLRRHRRGCRGGLRRAHRWADQCRRQQVSRPTAAPVVKPSVSATAVVLHPMSPLSTSSIVSASIGLQDVSGGTRVVGTCKYEAYPTSTQGRSISCSTIVPKHGTPERIGSWSAETGDSLPIQGQTWRAVQRYRERATRRSEREGPTGGQLT